jgi:hypothetical protein
MKLRAKNISGIQYIIISKGSPIVSTILPPETLIDSGIINFIKQCPLDLFQLHDSINYFEFAQRINYVNGYEVQFVNIENFTLFKSTIDIFSKVQIFFINAEIEDYLEIYKELNNREYTRYFKFFHSKDLKINLPNTVDTPLEFITKLIENQKKIIDELKLVQHKITPSMASEYKNYNEFLYFTPCASNYFLINNIIGNFGYEGALSKEEEEKRISGDSAKALKEINTFFRQNLFLKQIQRIDFFRSMCYRNEIVYQGSSCEPMLAPIIIISPFHHPDLKESIDDPVIVNVLQAEQSSNYINSPSKKQELKDAMSGGKIIHYRLSYLDDIGFLHSSFCFSPIIRLPVKGKSIYREISFFGKESFKYLGNPKTRKKIKKMISKVGKSLSQKTLSPELQRAISERNGQIIFISDLPIEWIEIEGIPLAFTHDICRLPETTLHGLMSFYTHNNMFEFDVPKNIMEKTLVIFGCSSANFKVWQIEAQEMSKSAGFCTRTCNSLKDLKEAIDELKPRFLIFDCHGGYDANTKSTYLEIGNEKLDGNYIVENKIFAPLIFISACGTAPTYGSCNTIANAFFEIGAVSVTTTYLPIAIESGSILYLRLLNKLNMAARQPTHKNWLEFVCHVIRTSTINEAFMNALKLKRTSPVALRTANIIALTEVLHFSNRKEVYHRLESDIKEFVGTDFNYFSTNIPEYLFYSNLGRGDLVLFESWKEGFEKNNLSKE